MEILQKTPQTPVEAVLFDFDGTISTLRYGWVPVMRQLMLELLGGGASSAALEKEVDDYIEESTAYRPSFK